MYSVRIIKSFPPDKRSRPSLAVKQQDPTAAANDVVTTTNCLLFRFARPDLSTPQLVRVHVVLTTLSAGESGLFTQDFHSELLYTRHSREGRARRPACSQCPPWKVLSSMVISIDVPSSLCPPLDIQLIQYILSGRNSGACTIDFNKCYSVHSPRILLVGDGAASIGNDIRVKLSGTQVP